MLCKKLQKKKKKKKIISRVINGPPVTTESRGRFESGFGYFEGFK